MYLKNLYRHQGALPYYEQKKRRADDLRDKFTIFRGLPWHPGQQDINAEMALAAHAKDNAQIRDRQKKETANLLNPGQRIAKYISGYNAHKNDYAHCRKRDDNQQVNAIINAVENFGEHVSFRQAARSAKYLAAQKFIIYPDQTACLRSDT